MKHHLRNGADILHKKTATGMLKSESSSALDEAVYQALSFMKTLVDLVSL